MVKNLPAMQEIWAQSLGQEDSLGKGMATHSGILAWIIPLIVQSMQSQRVGHNRVTFTFTDLICYLLGLFFFNYFAQLIAKSQKNYFCAITL